MYRNLTENNKALENITENNEPDANKMMNRIEREMNRIKHKSFGKVKFRTSNKENNKALVKLQQRKVNCKNEEEKIKVDTEIASELEKIRKKI